MIVEIDAHLGGGYFDLYLTTEEAENVANEIVNASSDQTRCKLAVRILSLLSDSALLHIFQADLKNRKLTT